MFKRFFEILYPKILVNIVVKNASTDVYIELLSKKALLNSVQAQFETIKPDEKMVDFIKNYIKESPFYYISLLDFSTQQGALPTCSKSKFSYYCDLSDSKYRCYEEKWTYYTSKRDLDTLQKSYKDIGVDFLFSPFVLLANFFKDKIETSYALYVLVQESSLAVAVFKNSQLLYAQYLDMQSNSSEVDDILLTDDIESDAVDFEMQESIDLEDIDVEDSEEKSELENFGDIEDLDSIEEIEEFDDSKDIEEELLESGDELKEADDESFNEDYQRFSLIQSSVADFYKDERYESSFLENIYIADGVGVSSDLKRYLEEEMFLNVYIRHVEIDAEVCELAKEELGL